MKTSRAEREQRNHQTERAHLLACYTATSAGRTGRTGTVPIRLPILPMKPLIIAIDGPSGAGKGTVARAIAGALGYRHVDSGAMYRAVGWKALHDQRAARR